MTQADPKNALYDEANDVFRKAAAATINSDTMRKVRVVPMPPLPPSVRAIQLGFDRNMVTLEEYAMYFDVTEANYLDRARDLGIIAGGMYMSLVQKAAWAGDKIVTDLLDKNLKFNFVLSDKECFATPYEKWGWVAFRFLFASTGDIQ